MTGAGQSSAGHSRGKPRPRPAPKWRTTLLRPKEACTSREERGAAQGQPDPASLARAVEQFPRAGFVCSAPSEYINRQGIIGDSHPRLRQPVHTANRAPRARGGRLLRDSSVRSRAGENSQDEAARNYSVRRAGQPLRRERARYRRLGAEPGLSGARNLLRALRDRAAHGRAQRGQSGARVRPRHADTRLRRQAIRGAQGPRASRVDESRRSCRETSARVDGDRA